MRSEADKPAESTGRNQIIKSEKKRKLKIKTDMLRSHGNSAEEDKRAVRWEGFAGKF